jgi:hypothetical protein
MRYKKALRNLAILNSAVASLVSSMVSRTFRNMLW